MDLLKGVVVPGIQQAIQNAAVAPAAAAPIAEAAAASPRPVPVAAAPAIEAAGGCRGRLARQTCTRTAPQGVSGRWAEAIRRPCGAVAEHFSHIIPTVRVETLVTTSAYVTSRYAVPPSSADDPVHRRHGECRGRPLGG